MAVRPPSPTALAAVRKLLDAAVPGPAGVVVLGIDGRSGAGKTTLARALRPQVAGGRVALDAIYPGWDGLDAGVERLVEWVLAPLAGGRPAAYHRWDWTAHRWRDDIHRVRADRPVIVDGVGVGAAICRPYLSALVWVDLPDDERRRRALDRDGATYEPHWQRWAAQEDDYLRRNDPRAAADRVVTV